MPILKFMAKHGCHLHQQSPFNNQQLASATIFKLKAVGRKKIRHPQPCASHHLHYKSVPSSHQPSTCINYQFVLTSNSHQLSSPLSTLSWEHWYIIVWYTKVWIFIPKKSRLIFIGPRSDHILRMSVTHSLTDSLTHWQTCWKLNELT